MKYFPLLISVLFSYAECRVETEQFIDIWFGKKCEGKPNYTWTEDANVTLPKNTPGEFLSTTNGLWRVTICSDENCLSNSITTMYGNGKDGCYEYSSSGEYSAIRAKRIGDANMNKTELWLYPERKLKGLSMIIKEDGRKGVNMAAKSYLWTGQKDWSITLVNGTKQCLKSEVKRIGYWLSYSFDDEIQVQDAVVGCS